MKLALVISLILVFFIVVGYAFIRITQEIFKKIEEYESEEPYNTYTPDKEVDSDI